MSAQPPQSLIVFQLRPKTRNTENVTSQASCTPTADPAARFEHPAAVADASEQLQLSQARLRAGAKKSQAQIASAKVLKKTNVRRAKSRVAPPAVASQKVTSSKRESPRNPRPINRNRTVGNVEQKENKKVSKHVNISIYVNEVMRTVYVYLNY